MKRKKRHRLPKIPDSGAEWGTVPLGQDPPVGPWGPLGRIQAYGNIARAWNRGTPRQRRAAAIFLGAIALPSLGGLIVWIVDSL
jgi:hypothetical protein